MQFTKKEIELAKQLKEAGLEWEPEVGDWFLHRDKAYIVRDIGRDFVQAIQSYPYDSEEVLAKCYSTWLPLWHQCRKYSGEHGWDIEIFHQSEDKIHLRLVKEKEIQNQPLGIEIDTITITDCHTDLEVMYQAILEVLDMSASSLNE